MKQQDTMKTHKAQESVSQAEGRGHEDYSSNTTLRTEIYTSEDE